MNTGEVIALIKAFGGGGGGSSGGGVLVVNETVDGDTHTLDKTYEEIMAAGFAVKKHSGDRVVTYDTLASSFGQAGVIFYVTFSDDPSAYYSASTSTGTLTYSDK